MRNFLSYLAMEVSSDYNVTEDRSPASTGARWPTACPATPRACMCPRYSWPAPAPRTVYLETAYDLSPAADKEFVAVEGANQPSPHASRNMATRPRKRRLCRQLADRSRGGSRPPRTAPVVRSRSEATDTTATAISSLLVSASRRKRPGRPKLPGPRNQALELGA